MLRRHGVVVTTVRKYSQGTGPQGEPTIVAMITDGEVDLIFNTPHGLSPDGRPRFDGYEIRTAAVLRNVPCVTTVQGLAAAVQGIEAIRAGQRRGALPAVLVRRPPTDGGPSTRGPSGPCCSGVRRGRRAGARGDAAGDRHGRPAPARPGPGWPRCAPGTGPRSPWPGSSSPAWSAWPPGWTRTASPSGPGARSASATSSWARSPRTPSRATTGRGCSGCRRAGRWSTGWASTTTARRRWPTGWRAAGVARGNRAVGIPVGVSIGKTKIDPAGRRAAEDYLTSLRLLAPYADYLAVNVSSPNTPGLRSLQDADTLAELVGALVAEARTLAGPARPLPILVKLAPDLTEDALEQALEVAERPPGRPG